ncbi:MAG: tRNA (N6-isopentenyl adenosine(37)-C2)-methylthiotransferase MiaB [Clostridia bacterium]|nr:tRNA (N6-isopentenyl adenosine(37)-C2)-methylthiotransferase MiaB [Clostridia bacterium]
MKKYTDFNYNDITQQYELCDELLRINRDKEAALGRRLRVCVETFGCQQNEADSERILGWAIRCGYEKCSSIEEADLIVYNTCAVREHAELRALSKTGQLKHLKEKNPELLIGLWGCMVAQEHRKNTIKFSYPYVDFVAGTNMLHRFPEILFDVVTNKRRRYYVDTEDYSIVEGSAVERDSNFRAWVSVMYGCNNFCTYCVVPYVRGRERSRSPKAILDEVRELAEKGYKEITLLGQNVNSYGKSLPEDERISFAELLEKICEIPGDFLVRFMTSHPKDASDELIEVMARNPKIARHFHLPMQSGSSEVLKAMNRHYDRERYFEVARKIKAAMPDITLTTDIIVGFPGETDEQFEDTISAIKEVEFDSIYAFIFSPRNGTPAAEMDDPITKEEKSARFSRLLEIESEVNANLGKRLVGREMRILVDSHPEEDGTSTGRNSGNKIIRFNTDKDYYGEYINVRVTSSEGASVYAEII